MRVIHCGRCLLVLLALLGILSVCLGDETAGEGGATIEGETEATTDDEFELNDLLPGIEDPNSKSFVENFIMGNSEVYTQVFDPVRS